MRDPRVLFESGGKYVFDLCLRHEWTGHRIHMFLKTAAQLTDR